MEFEGVASHQLVDVVKEKHLFELDSVDRHLEW